MRAEPRQPSRPARIVFFVLALSVILWVGARRRAELGAQLLPSGITGDAGQYYLMAVQLRAHHTLAFADGKPAWTRLPAWPIAIALFTDPVASYTLARALPRWDVVPVTEANRAWQQAAGRVGASVDLAVVALVALLGAALGGGRFALLAALAWAIQPWTTVFTQNALADPLATLFTVAALAALARAAVAPRIAWFAAAGALAGAALLTRVDALLLIPLPLLVAARLPLPVRARLVRAAVGLAAFAVVFAPWPIRNLIQFRHAHPLGAINVDDRGRPFDRDEVTAWLRTFSSSERVTTQVAWRFPERKVSPDALPPDAFDSPEQRQRTVALLRDYNDHGGRLDAPIRAGFAELASERCHHHRFACFVRLPLQRVRLMLLAPHDGYGLGTLPDIEHHRAAWTRLDHALTLLGLLGLLVALLRRGALRDAALPTVVYLVGRCALVSRVHVEPRYLLEALPLLAAAASVVPARLLALATRLTRGRATVRT